MNELYASIKKRLSSSDIDLATRRDIAEKVHLAATEPEAVTYAEVDAGGGTALHRPERIILWLKRPVQTRAVEDLGWSS